MPNITPLDDMHSKFFFAQRSEVNHGGLPTKDRFGKHYSHWRSPRVLTVCDYCNKFVFVTLSEFKNGQKKIFCKSAHRRIKK